MNGQSRYIVNIVHTRDRTKKQKHNKTQTNKTMKNTNPTKIRGEPRCSRRESIFLLYNLIFVMTSFTNDEKYQPSAMNDILYNTVKKCTNTDHKDIYKQIIYYWYTIYIYANSNCPTDTFHWNRHQETCLYKVWFLVWKLFIK